MSCATSSGSTSPAARCERLNIEFGSRNIAHPTRVIPVYSPSRREIRRQHSIERGIRRNGRICLSLSRVTACRERTMSDHPDERSTPVSESSDNYPSASRRRVLQAAAAAGGVVGLSGIGAAQFDTQTIELGAETSGWQGVSPDAIADETNPTLELEEGPRTKSRGRTSTVPHTTSSSSTARARSSSGRNS